MLVHQTSNFRLRAGQQLVAPPNANVRRMMLSGLGGSDGSTARRPPSSMGKSRSRSCSSGRRRRAGSDDMMVDLDSAV